LRIAAGVHADGDKADYFMESKQARASCGCAEANGMAL